MTVSLQRGGLPVYNFFSAVSNLKETNLTAYVAYLIAAFPDHLGKRFLENREVLQEIGIENMTEDRDRYDIVLNTNKRVIVIEAKLGFRQTERQISRYLDNLIHSRGKRAILYLLDHGSFKSEAWLNETKRSLPRRVGLEYVRWANIYDDICDMLRFKRAKVINEPAYYIARELKDFMEVNGMSTHTRKEVYVRDLSGDSIELFFRYRIYKSQPKFFNSAPNNLYFAPYFTGRAPEDFAERSMIRIEKGISWIAPIIDLQQLKRGEIAEYLKSKGHADHREAAKEIFRESSRKELLIFLLGDPFLAFLTPISKRKLGLHGPMGSRSYSFGELFTAAGKGD